jgi:predicted ribosomally synthesized peptide with nif11-like leader
MLEEQLSSLLIILKEDAVLRKKLQGDDEFYVIMVLAIKAGFDASKTDMISFQANRASELSDDALESVDSGTMSFDEFECSRREYGDPRWETRL